MRQREGLGYKPPVTEVPARPSRAAALLVVLTLSALALLLQLVQVRLFSFVYWYHLMYYIVTMALLGFAASGTLLAVSPRLRGLPDASFFLLCLVGFSLTAYVSTQVACHPVVDTRGAILSQQGLAGMSATYALVAVPYLFAGLAVSGAFMRFPDQSAKLYFASLGGSGIGCLLFVALITPLGAPKLLLAAVLLPPLLALLLPGGRRHLAGLLLWGGFLAFALSRHEGHPLLRLDPVGNKQFWQLIERPVVEFTQWNPVSRIDVIADPEDPGHRNVLMDGDAQAWLVDAPYARQVQKRTLHSLLYKVHAETPRRALVIGAGGGFDVHVALGHHAAEVDAVEFNPSTVAVVTRTHARAIGEVFSLPNVHLHEAEGRSFIRRSDARYDTIMLYGTDSLVGLSTGAYVLADSYLYTLEALEDYLGHLAPDGMMQLCRWSYAVKPREDLRTFTTAVEACARAGFRNPLGHVAVVLGEEELAAVLVKRSEFTPEETGRMLAWCAARNCRMLYPAVGPKPYPQRAEHFHRFADAFRQGRQEAFYADYEFDVKPVSDDNPFFFQHNRWDFLFGNKATKTAWDYMRGMWTHFVLLGILLQSVLLSVLLVCVPLALNRRRGVRLAAPLPTLVYFAALGFGFMLAEIAVIQKCVLFLGHPGYSLALTMPAILIAAGLGSYASGFLDRRPARAATAATLLCAALLLSLRYVLPALTPHLLQQAMPVRALGVVLLVAPAAFCMGIPFPLAVRKLVAGDAVPWAWAVNGTASVVASVVAILLAMRFGFSAVLWTAAGCYLCAAAALRRFAS